MKKELINRMEKALENAMAYLTVNERTLFIYYAGQAQSLLELLEDEFGYEETQYTEHIANMWEITENAF
ncbi:MAG: hypothetical protein J6L24_05125 [Oscillospiraceae bacterium]|nr:hypothetical protein [Oscillospiraceae bacterium]